MVDIKSCLPIWSLSHVYNKAALSSTDAARDVCIITTWGEHVRFQPRLHDNTNTKQDAALFVRHRLSSRHKVWHLCWGYNNKTERLKRQPHKEQLLQKPVRSWDNPISQQLHDEQLLNPSPTVTHQHHNTDACFSIQLDEIQNCLHCPVVKDWSPSWIKKPHRHVWCDLIHSVKSFRCGAVSRGHGDKTQIPRLL